MKGRDTHAVTLTKRLRERKQKRHREGDANPDYKNVTITHTVGLSVPL